MKAHSHLMWIQDFLKLNFMINSYLKQKVRGFWASQITYMLINTNAGTDALRLIASMQLFAHS